VQVAAALFALLLHLLLIFILQSGQPVSISYFGAHGHLPLGVALLLAAVLGVFLVVIPWHRADHPAADNRPPPPAARRHRGSTVTTPSSNPVSQ
jgi:hypothetical protein